MAAASSGDEAPDNEDYYSLLNVRREGTISVGVDATDLFDRYDEEFEDVSASPFPHIEINRMHISQSIELEFGAGDLQGPVFGLKMFRNLTQRW
ncbi:hypothetical protein E2320_006339 [Naja naja]|nr:hypothetical protein E2320_006339 [Naja naja]